MQEKYQCAAWEYRMLDHGTPREPGAPTKVSVGVHMQNEQTGPGRRACNGSALKVGAAYVHSSGAFTLPLASLTGASC